jgi:flavin-dependent dehydrogenase
MTDYEVAIVGGRIGGAALAKVLAENGMRVLVVEREREFKDRVRGEYITPCDGAEAQKLGLHDALLETCGNQQPYWNALGSPIRDLRLTTPQQLPAITFYHPVMQKCS